MHSFIQSFVQSFILLCRSTAKSSNRVTSRIESNEVKSVGRGVKRSILRICMQKREFQLDGNVLVCMQYISESNISKTLNYPFRTPLERYSLNNLFGHFIKSGSLAQPYPC